MTSSDIDVATVEVYVWSNESPPQHEKHQHLIEPEPETFLVWKGYLHCRTDLTVCITVLFYRNKQKNHLRKSHFAKASKNFWFHTKNLCSLDWGYSHKKSEDMHSFHCAWSVFFQGHIILTIFRCQWGFQVLSELSTKSLMLIKVCAFTLSVDFRRSAVRLPMDRVSEMLSSAVIEKSGSSSQGIK